MSSQLNIQVSQPNSSVSKSSSGDLKLSKNAGNADVKVLGQASSSGNELPVVNGSQALAGSQDPEKFADAVKKVEENIQHTRREIKFEVNEELGTSVVSVLDQDTKEVIRQFPPEEVIALAERVADMASDGGKLFKAIV